MGNASAYSIILGAKGVGERVNCFWGVWRIGFRGYDPTLYGDAWFSVNRLDAPNVDLSASLFVLS